MNTTPRKPCSDSPATSSLGSPAANQNDDGQTTNSADSDNQRPQQLDREQARNLLRCDWCRSGPACVGCVTEVAAALAVARAEGPQWRPIAEAPKDGTLFLANKNGGATIVGRMGKVKFNVGYPSEGERETFLMFPSGLTWNPTHWMPLPAPPVREEAAP